MEEFAKSGWCRICEIGGGRDLAKIIYFFVNGDLPDWYYFNACAIRVQPIKKKGCPPGDERPIGAGNCDRRAWESEVIKNAAPAAAEYFWTLQVSVGVVGGGQLLSKGAQLYMEQELDGAMMSLDATNAFSEMCRGASLEQCLAQPAGSALRNLAPPAPRPRRIWWD